MTCLQKVVLPVQARAHFAVLASAYLKMCILPRRNCVSAKKRGSRLGVNTIFSLGRRWHRKAQKSTEERARIRSNSYYDANTEQERERKRLEYHARKRIC